jgi:hypothetical protein
MTYRSKLKNLVQSRRASAISTAEPPFYTLEPRFGLAKTRARDAWHLTKQVTRKRLVHTVGVWLNLQRGREPL